MLKGDIFTKKLKITPELRNGFIELFNCRALIHTDEEYSKKRGYKSFILHGNVLSGFISFFVDECFPDKNAICYSQNIKFSNPVYVNDELNFHAEIIEIHESVKIAEVNFFFENEEKLKVAKGSLTIGIT